MAIPYDPDKHCGAKTHSNGTPCTKVKGWRCNPPHPGVGRCYLHGGNTPTKKALEDLTDPVRSQIPRETFEARVQRAKADPELTVAAAAPGVFTANGAGTGAPAAYAALYRADGTVENQTVFSCGTGGCVTVPMEAGAAGDSFEMIARARRSSTWGEPKRKRLQRSKPRSRRSLKAPSNFQKQVQK